MEATAEYTRKSIFMDHPLVLTDIWAKASAATDFKAGSVLMVSDGVVSLATDAMTADTLLGVLPGESLLSATGMPALISLFLLPAQRLPKWLLFSPLPASTLSRRF